MSNLVCSQQRKLPLIYFLLLVLIVIPGRALPQCELLAHPNRDTMRNNSLASTFFEFKGKVYFNAFDDMGYALYCSDGTPDGTRCLTRDITPAGFTSCGDWLYVYGSKPQYTKNYDNPWAKNAIWRMRADGSERQKLADHYRPYSVNYNQTFLWSAGHRVYYRWRGGLSWIDNDTGSVTEFYQGLQDTSSYRKDYFLENHALADKGLFFTGLGESKENFFFTNLSDRAAVPLADLKTSGSPHAFDNMLIFKDKCYVLHVADSSKLWESDGTREGTKIIWEKRTYLPDGYNNPFFSFFFQYQNNLIFDLLESSSDSASHSIYSFDGISVKLLHKHPGEWQNFTFVKSPDALFVIVRPGYNSGINEIWRLDSTGYHHSGTINRKAVSRNDVCWQDHLIIWPTVDSLLFLDDQTLKPVYSKAIQCRTLYQTGLGFFFNKYEDGYTRDPYVLQTSPPTCRLLKRMVRSFVNGSIDGLFQVGNDLYFRANSDSTGMELWATGGNPENTRMVKEINTSSGQNWIRSTSPNAFIGYRNQLLFTALGWSKNYMQDYDFTGLWITDGTEKGTIQLESLILNETVPHNTKVVFGDKIWFIGKTKNYGDTWKLWVSDGQPGGATIFDKDFTGLHFENLYGLTVAGDLLYFFGSSGGELGLWATDGTESGTRSIDQLIGDQDYDYSLYFTPQIQAAGAKLYFTRDRLFGMSEQFQTKTREVWVTDGTKAGTRCLADFGNDFTKNQFIQFLGIHQGNLAFTYSTPHEGLEMWYTEGDPSTTRQLTGQWDTKPNPDKYFSGIASLDDRFFFCGFTEENGYELWVSDGTATGTHIFFELAHGQMSTMPGNFTVIGDKMLFFCSGEGLTDRLWITDGTLEGTEPLPWTDMDLGAIYEVRYWQGAIYFVACDLVTGDGLYRYQLPGTLGSRKSDLSVAKMNIRIYPNPATDFITIEPIDNPFPVTLRLFNNTGTLISEFCIGKKSATFNIANLPPGLYFVQNEEFTGCFVKAAE